jgi:hypothetical protein
VHSETHDEEEAKSEGSAGSEWLVVSEGRDAGSSQPKTSPSSSISERYLIVHQMLNTRLVF